MYSSLLVVGSNPSGEWNSWNSFHTNQN